MGFRSAMDKKKQGTIRVGVCVKPIPDPNIISLDKENRLDCEDQVSILNPCDLVATEEAVRLKEKGDAGSVTILSVSSPVEKPLLRRCLAMGADRAVCLWDPSLEGIYNDGTGRALARLIRHLGLELILCGQQASDDDMGVTGYVIAAELGMPFIKNVARLEKMQEGTLSVWSKVGGGKREVIETGLPAVLGMETDINEPRYAGLPALISALRAQVEDYDLQTLGVTEKDIASTMQCVGYSIPRPRPKKVFVPDTSLSAAERLNLVMSGGVSKKSDDIFEGSPEELSEKFVAYLNQVNVLDPEG